MIKINWASIGKIFCLTYSILTSYDIYSTSCEYSEPVTKFIFGKSIDTIGDSITSADNVTKSLRCLLRDKGLKYDFVGNYVDKFGFMHDGVPANTTLSILNRINTIPYADAYFLLAGTNDSVISANPYVTVINLVAIAGYLNYINPKGIIFINTLLPTTNTNYMRNFQINNILIYLNNQKKLCKNCFLIDAGMKFYSIPEWQNYIDESKVHLTSEGYQIFTDLIMESFTSAHA